MVGFKFDGKDFYIDGRLKKQFDNKVIPDLKKKDMDVVFAIDGPERSGKSVASMVWGAYIASELKTEFNLSNVCMTPVEFRTKIINSKKNQVVIYDEAHRGMASARALSEINKILKDLMMEMGQKNLMVIINIPTFFLLDKYAALFRARGLFHIYFNKGGRGFWVYYNRKNKMKLYMKGKKEYNYDCMKYPHFRGRFYNQYTLNEEKYREKKAESFKDKPRLTRAEVLTAQRDALIRILYEKEKYSIKDIEKLLKQNRSAISKRRLWEIVAENKEKHE